MLKVSSRSERLARVLLASLRRSRIAKAVLASYAYEKFKQFIAEKYAMLAEAVGFGIRDIGKGGYAIHHFGNTTRLIHDGLKANEYARYTAVLNGESDEPALKLALESEIAHLVILPVWFHNYIHGRGLPNYKSRREYYDALRTLLLTEESYRQIKALKFNGSNIPEALKSIRNLSLLLPAKHNRKLLDKLYEVYTEIQDGLLAGFQI